jgi:hypothetical protein
VDFVDLKSEIAIVVMAFLGAPEVDIETVQMVFESPPTEKVGIAEYMI